MNQKFAHPQTRHRTYGQILPKRLSKPGVDDLRLFTCPSQNSSDIHIFMS